MLDKEHLAMLVKLCAIHGFRSKKYYSFLLLTPLIGSKQQKHYAFQSYQKRNDYLKQFHGLAAANNIMTPVKGKDDPWGVLSSFMPSQVASQNG